MLPNTVKGIIILYDNYFSRYTLSRIRRNSFAQIDTNLYASKYNLYLSSKIGTIKSTTECDEYKVLYTVCQQENFVYDLDLTRSSMKSVDISSEKC